MGKVKKSPWLTAILNFLVPGLGYVYAGKKIGFGIGLVLSGMILAYLYYTSGVKNPLLVIDASILGILFAYDGYKTAQEVNKQR